MTGAKLVVACELGTGTFNIYSRTKDHIEEQGELDERFAKTILGQDNITTGYCTNRGPYMAAKKYNQLDVYEAAKEECSINLIPNF